MVFLITLPIFILLIPENPISWIIGLFAYFCICFYCHYKHPLTYIKSYFSIDNIAITVLTAFILSLCFTFRINFENNRTLYTIFSYSLINKISFSSFIFLSAVLLGILSIFGIDYFAKILIKNPKNTIACPTKTYEPLGYRIHLFLFIISALVITLCSECSPIYPFNSWDDSNCFFTVGKSMPYGLVPYRDLYEHKGPLLYTLHALASLVSYDSFLGIYFIEIISCYAFLVYLFKSLNIFYERKYILILIPIFCSLIYSSAPFSCGDSAEEFCLPLLAYTFYIGLKCIKNFSLPTNKESFIIGITSGSVLWIKYTMLGLHIGWMIVPIYLAIKSKSIRNFITMLLYIVLGVTVATIPFILYFGINNAIYDWFNIYFYTNIFTYGSTSSSSLIDSLIQTWFGIYSIWIKSGIELFLISFGLIWAAFKKNKLYLYYALSLSVFMMIFTYGGGKRYIYYAFTLWILAILGMCACVEVLICLISNIDCKFNSKTGLCLFSSVIISIVLVLICNQNIKLVTYSQADLPQYKVNSDILESGVENPSLLNFGFLDGGFYTTTGIIPNCRHFCYLNIPLEEMKEEQMSYVYNGITDFVITQNFEISTDKYRLLNSYDDPYSGHNYTYYLYQKTS